jgi:Fe-S oxidoreductase
MHSTRGRARLLFEMLRGDPLTDGWRNDHVKDALDLCLACKGCKSDCPVNVDMATYKAEFLSHYYAGRVRPRHAYAMGLIYWWARLAALMPGVVNFFTQTPLLRDVTKALGGIAPQRQVPVFAPRTFVQWFRARGLRNEGSPQVLLWPDTFNNHFFPEVGQAAVEVLEAAGYQVTIPTQSLCCGRPLYDFGMLDLAKRLLGQILQALRPQIEAGVPVIGLEPSCVAVFRDELTNLFPHNEDAKRLSKKTYLLSEFLEHTADHYQLPQLKRKAVMHGHCHQKAIMGLESDKKMLAKLGLDYVALDSGCCGMAGSFGFEQGHYEVSRQVGELVLLPAVREAAKDTLIIADGFSCREQIAQTTDRRALHLAQVMQMALHQQSADLPQAYPERQLIKQPEEPFLSLPVTAALVGVGVLVGGLLMWGLKAEQRGAAARLTARRTS